MAKSVFPHREQVGLYDPSYEHDACGVAFIAHLDGNPRHGIVEKGLEALRNLDHRGATGADEAAGDGAGILIQVPDAFLRAVVDSKLPDAGEYAAGMAFLPVDEQERARVKAEVEAIADEVDLDVLAWRDVPVETSTLSPVSLGAMPHFAHLVVAGRNGQSGIDLDRFAFVLRRRAQHEAGLYFASLSSRTMVYKGMLTTAQLEEVFPELHDERVESALALVHSRFSTNTFPAWELAHPYRMIAHNGEINTVRGNRNWMRAREALLTSKKFPGALEKLFPICSPGGSDSASFDEVLELLHLGGRSLPHAVLMMIPEAWEGHAEMDPKRRAFYEFHSMIMEPWDGPACMTFTDGSLIGACLDRNGLRPGRYWVTRDGLVVFASEAGVLPVPVSDVVTKGRLQPGRMFLIDLVKHQILSDDEVKGTLAAQQPYERWVAEQKIELDQLPSRAHIVHSHSSVTRRQQTFGYTHEELRLIVAPMANDGAEAIGSMGTDTPEAILSARPRLIFDYFKQLFAQVTNPPLDAIREQLVTSLTAKIGPEHNLLEPGPEAARMITMSGPILDSEQLAKIVRLNRDGELPGYSTHVVKGLYKVAGGGRALASKLEELCQEVSSAIRGGARAIVLSDRHSTAELAPIPSLLLTAAIHHHLVREKTRTQVGLVVEAGDVREVHHVALLLGYGAAAVNPYLVFESAEDLARREMYVDVPPEKAIANVAKAFNKGVLKVMSKMGVSTVASYTGAQIFECVGLSGDVVDAYFTGTSSRLGGLTLSQLAEEISQRHLTAYPSDGIPLAHRDLMGGGEYQWRREGEQHLFDPETVFRLQHSTQTGDYQAFKKYSALVNDNSRRVMTLRSMMQFGERQPIDIDEVEPATEIVKRFSTGAMSYGSISMEAHQTLAVAMNRIGGKSNTGEGGEDPERLHDPARRSAIKQVASGRFGVTSEYLTYADDIQIKMAQGAKPGEGGQLPGPKVYPWVARTRHSTPGVGLISPPPHHDIYSIEDLKQLIHDLKCANPSARVHVKLVSEIGVGTVAAGVSKAKADVVLISGHDGGTGAAPLTSIKHAGTPWELGLAETQQTLLLNGLRDRIVVQCDGQLKTGRDVVVAALLGAEEFGFATAPLVVSGCIMMRVCHKDTCPVGVATQNPELRGKFHGDPDHVVNFFMFIAEEVRELLAQLGFRTLEEAVGHVELLDVSEAVGHWKTGGLDLTPILTRVEVPVGAERFHTTTQDHGLADKLDVELIRLAEPALARGEKVSHTLEVRNVDRTVGTMLGHEVTKVTDGRGLEPGTIEFTLNGTGGQSFGAFLPGGVTLRLIGDSNDYFGKGLSGGRLVVTPHPESGFDPATQIVAGNVIGYGATSGQMFLRGLVGERFCVRNSGATAVVEGVGDHGAEYMTGGEVLVLGPTGRNFAAGMSGGVAWVLDLNPLRLNNELADPVEMTPGDLIRVRDLMGEHREETGSLIADALLKLNDEELSRRFTKVLPRDYARVVAVQEMSAADGLEEFETTKLMMEAAHG
ncbi:glutamate synthase (NADPH/NADH) large chain [Tessaracoccus bendigoensis DSM 12906]|uniref:Glutamate synthase (NADPH/NADH) large chain n=1 Tax=Tessaracoccus bendigoensis DSM 12906 TaxID=1123357 RepID=A0A1M6CMR9_9ACTN|nr:glutamate synthase large subunit [Tessaracoccus bendigoensis]SHI62296.1 glutamate synthase (NADPH/NADH) large chain [Tessaracoccus bendigoensis DSM 12906]